MKTLIENNYIINEFGYSIDDNLKENSHMNSSKFLNLVYESVCDFIVENNINIETHEDVEKELNTTFKKDTFKRCQAIQAIYVLENADTRFIYGETTNIAPAVKRIIRDTLKLFQRTRVLR